jgi:nitrogen fixation/metabolism regulation signal transduction histidine kinase
MNVRLGDGIMLGLVLVVGAWVTLLVHHGMDTNFGTRISLNNVLSLSLTCFVVAFIVGFTVIVIARSVAHSGLATNPDDGF